MYKKIQKYIRAQVTGDGYEMVEVQNRLLELFEEASAEGRKVLDITGEDVTGFAEELLNGVDTRQNKAGKELNDKIKKYIEKADKKLKK